MFEEEDLLQEGQVAAQAGQLGVLSYLEMFLLVLPEGAEVGALVAADGAGEGLLFRVNSFMLLKIKECLKPMLQ